jgi:urease accessory protein
MTPSSNAKVVAAAAGVVALSGPPALAHHVMGGVTPETLWQGLLSGLAHPIVGVDHFAFILGVGFMSWFAGQVALLPFLFVLGTVVGCLVHVQGLDLPVPELVIAFTLAVAAAFIAVRSRIPTGIMAILFVAAGIFHGYAYGESIVGAETTPLIAYMTGFACIQYSVAVGIAWAVRFIVAKAYVTETTATRLASGAMACVAAIAIAIVVLAA